MKSQELKEVLSLNLKKFRKEKGWSQFELAEKAGISEQTMNSIEGLRLWPSDKTLSKLTSALKIEPYLLFIPQKISLKSESAQDLKRAAVQAVQDFIRDALQDWQTSEH